MIAPAGSAGRAAAAPAQEPGADDLQERIDRAVERGRKALEGRFRGVLDSTPNDYPMGKIALPLAALLRSGIPSDHPLVREAFGRLEDLPLQKTYCVACYLFALDAFWQRFVKENRKSSSLTAVQKPVSAQGKVRRKMEELVAWLIDARVKGKGIWSYGPSRSAYDYSNSQFAVLGLQVGIENDIPVPRDVLIEIAEHFIRTQQQDGPAMEIEVTFNPPIEKAFTPTYVARTIKRSAPPSGWNYRSGGGKPYASMTAAGTSNLLVVREGLRKMRALSPALDERLEAALFSAYGWITRNFKDYIQGSSHYYYTLYSLEKVGDLGDILKFAAHDWYREGAEALIGRQRNDGSWGDFVDTSLALLFLTRATRPHIRAQAAPTIFTIAPGEKEKEGGSGDLVFIDELEGFISARQFFDFFRERRARELVPVGDQVVRNYALDRQEELIPHLLSLWSERQDPATTFARKALGEITGVRGRGREFYEDWHKRYLEIAALIRGDNRDPELIGALLAAAGGIRLKGMLLNLIEREGLIETFNHLAAELAVNDAAYRARVHGILARFSGNGLPPPDGASRTAWEQAASYWRDWWRTNSGAVLADRSIRRTVEALNRFEPSGRTDRAAARAELLEALVKEGKRAVPVILQAMGGEKFRIELVIALERISGERRGFLPEAWQRWWSESGGR